MFLLPRRSFLSKVGLGLVAFIPAAKVLMGKAEARTARPTDSTGPISASTAGAPPSSTQPPNPAPPPTKPQVEQRFSQGIALSVSTSQIAINSLNRGNETIHLGAQTDLWEGRWVKDLPTSQGDTVTAWGQRRSDGSLDAEKLWVNIKNVIGSVVSAASGAAPQTFAVNGQRQGSVSVKLDPRTLVAHRGSPKAALGTAAIQLSAGESIQVIGRELNGIVLATDMYIDS